MSLILPFLFPSFPSNPQNNLIEVYMKQVNESMVEMLETVSEAV